MKTVLMKVSELQQMPIHRVAAGFPELNESELLELAQDIEENGILHNIVTWEGQLLDGRNRLTALAKTNIFQVEVDVFEGSEYEAVCFIWSVNIKRRHLDAGQRTMLVEQLFRPYEEAEAKRRMSLGGQGGLNSVQLDEKPVTSGRVNEILAEKASVSKDTVRKAHTLAMNAPDLAEEVKQGDKKLEKAFQEFRTRSEEDDRKIALLRLDRHQNLLRKYETGQLSLDDAAAAAKVNDNEAARVKRENNPDAIIDIENICNYTIDHFREFGLKIGRQLRTLDLVDRALDFIDNISGELLTIREALERQYAELERDE